MSLRLGIDVGGTNTDAVILDEKDEVRAKAKRFTSVDISSGIKEAVDSVIEKSGIDPAQIGHAMLGTTHATNAIVERKGLSRVGIIRLGAPSGLSLPPMMDWPQDIVACIGQAYRIVKGGYEYSGKPIWATDEEEVKQGLKRAG